MKELFRNRQDRLYLLLLGAIAIATHVKWLFEFKVFTSGDWWYIGLARFTDFRHFSPIWVTDGLGSTSAVPPFYFIRFLEGLTTFIGGSFIVTEKLFFFLPIILGSTFGAYIFLREYAKPAFAFLGTLIFAFNTAMIFNYAGALTIATAYALCPVALFLFRRYMLRPKNTPLLVQNALLFALIAAYEQRIVLLVFGMAFGLVIFNSAFGGWKYLRPRLVPVAKILMLFILLHAFWLVPYAMNAHSGVTFSNLLSRQLFVSFSNIQNALTLFHPFWTGSRPATFVVQHIPAIAWVLPVVAFAGYLAPQSVRQKVSADKEYMYWALVALIGMFLVKQVNDPFPTVYPWLYGHLPGSAAFREASKFYILIIMGYSVLVPRSIALSRAYYNERLARRRIWWQRLLYIVPTFAVGFVIFLNVIPLLSGSFKTMYTARNKPKDYKLFNTFIGKQKDFFRVLWVPSNSRWGDQSNIHPSLTVSQMNRGDWLSQLGADPDDALATLRDKSEGLFNKQTSGAALDSASVKYVVVPLRDTANEDDFFSKYGDDRQKYIEQLNDKPYLQKLDIGTRQLLVYENKNYTGYISVSNSLQQVQDNVPSLNDIYTTVVTHLKQAFSVVVDRNGTQQVKSTAIVKDPFSGITRSQVGVDGAITATAGQLTNPVLYVKNQQSVRYAIHNGTITFYGKNNDQLSANNQPLQSPDAETVLAVKQLDPQKSYALQLGDHVYPLTVTNDAKSLGTVHAPIKLYEYDRSNAMPDSSFEQGLWQHAVEDCNNYDHNAAIGMTLDDKLFNDGKKSLQLIADKHTACTTSASIPVTAKSYDLSFDYLVTNTQTAGYQVVFDDPQHTVIKQDINRQHSYWQTFRRVFDVPAGAKNFTIKLLGYPDYLKRYTGVTNYDTVQLHPMVSITNVTDSSSAVKMAKLPHTSSIKLKYSDDSVPASKNLVSNSGFESGTWQKKVGDCNDYDDNASIKMALAKGHESKHSLELSALTHAACTSQGGMPINSMQSYLLSFDYQSKNSKFAYYRIEFNDPDNTEISGSASVKNSGWQTFNRQIQAPFGATKARIALFAYESQYKTKWVTVRYDNIGLRNVPNATSQFILTSGVTSFKEPKGVTFKYKSATHKTVHITGATTSFYINMAESFNPLWQLRPQGGSMPNGAITHYAWNDFANGWYIDLQKLCADGASTCHRNSDGSYDIDFDITFAAQKWFYLGSGMSGVTLVACVSYLVCKRRKRSPQPVSYKTRRRHVINLGVLENRRKQ